MTPDEIIEVLQGFKAGRGWQFLSTANEWKTPILSSLESMLHALYSGQTIRLALLPDEITKRLKKQSVTHAHKCVGVFRFAAFALFAAGGFLAHG